MMSVHEWMYIQLDKFTIDNHFDWPILYFLFARGPANTGVLAIIRKPTINIIPAMMFFILCISLRSKVYFTIEFQKHSIF